MPSPSGKRWWRLAASHVKDRCSLYLAKSELEVALIKATSHDPSRLDYRNVSRVFSWVKTSPSSSLPLVLSLLSRRSRRSRSWPVALKSLLLSHGLLLLSPSPPPALDHLSLFIDPKSPPSFSTFVRSYSSFLSLRSHPPAPRHRDPHHQQLLALSAMQDLLDRLLRVIPSGSDMAVPLVLEAMDCVVVEILDVYGAICNGIAHALVEVFGSPSFFQKESGEEPAMGAMGIRVLRRAREQSAKLSRYFEVCKSLGVVNASDLPVVDSVAEEDIEELERLVVGGGHDGGVDEEEEEGEAEVVMGDGELKTVVTREWVVFDGEQSGDGNGKRNPFACSGTPWELQPVYSHHSLCHGRGGEEVGWDGRDLLAL